MRSRPRSVHTELSPDGNLWRFLHGSPVLIWRIWIGSGGASPFPREAETESETRGRDLFTFFLSSVVWGLVRLAECNRVGSPYPGAPWEEAPGRQSHETVRVTLEIQSIGKRRRRKGFSLEKTRIW